MSQPTGNERAPSGMTRRELLKRGAVVGGTLVWAAPVVQMIGMTPAMASHVSQLCICVKFDSPLDPNQNTWTSVGMPGAGRCVPTDVNCDTSFSPDSSFTVGGDVSMGDSGCSGAADTFCIEKNGSGKWTVYYPLYCTLIESWAKCGNNCRDHVANMVLTFGSTANANFVVIDDPCPGVQQGESHFEFCFQC